MNSGSGFNAPMQPAFFTNPHAMGGSPAAPGRSRGGNGHEEDNSIDIDMNFDEDLESNELDVDLGEDDVNWDDITHTGQGGGNFSGKSKPRSGMSFYKSSKPANKFKAKRGRGKGGR